MITSIGIPFPAIEELLCVIEQVLLHPRIEDNGTEWTPRLRCDVHPFIVSVWQRKT